MIAWILPLFVVLLFIGACYVDRCAASRKVS